LGHLQMFLCLAKAFLCLFHSRLQSFEELVHSLVPPLLTSAADRYDRISISSCQEERKEYVR
jgi:hypothetical protein